MTDEVPPDVAETLTQLLAEARDLARRGARESVRDTLDEVETIVTSELADGDLRDRLLHGCEQVGYLSGDDPLAAAEYCRAMHDALVETVDDDLDTIDDLGQENFDEFDDSNVGDRTDEPDD